MFSSSLQWFQDAEDQQLRLLVDNVPFTELPLAPEEKLLFRTPIVNNFEGRIQSTEFVLKCQDFKKFKNVDFPIPLMIPEYKLKLQLFFSEDGKEFVFIIFKVLDNLKSDMKKFVLELVHEVFECSLAFDEQADQMKLKVDDVEFEDILLAPEQILMHR